MSSPSRRTVVSSGLAALAAAAFASPASARGSGQARRFSHDAVIEEARRLARARFEAPPDLPAGLSGLDYDAYRAIRFRPERAVWANTASKFSIQMFAPGSIYQQPVDVRLVESGVAHSVALPADAFDTPDAATAALIAEVGRLAGFRVHYPINTARRADEFVVFQGASYFRAVSRDQIYGLSARGLAIDTGEPGGEEFPVFRRFWIERPSPSMDAIVIHALLDSRRVTGAYRFAIAPGAPTAIDIEATLFPRVSLTHVGLGCLTSMYMHGPLDAPDLADHRPAVHDSLGLAIHTGAGERLWRPLSNPRSLQMAAFLDRDPRGFGLAQRDRDFADYQDLEARYERRPSAWVEPRSGWGEGHVQLVEIPSEFEGNDNIVAYWRPAAALEAGGEHRFSYRLTWPDDIRPGASIGAVTRSAFGRRLTDRSPQLVVDWSNPGAANLEEISIEVSMSGGARSQVTVAPNPVTNGFRVYLTLVADIPAMTEIRMRPVVRGEAVGETWLYRHIQRG